MARPCHCRYRTVQKGFAILLKVQGEKLLSSYHIPPKVGILKLLKTKIDLTTGPLLLTSVLPRQMLGTMFHAEFRYPKFPLAISFS